MKRIVLMTIILGGVLHARAQQDSIPTRKNVGDTIRVGGIIIINKSEKNDDGVVVNNDGVRIHRRKYSSPGNLTTQWVIIDFGLNNYNDKTDYASAGTQAFSPGATGDRFALRNGKSINFNLWFFMQKWNVYKHVINLKYGLGIETFNFRYTNNIIYREEPMRIEQDTINYSKNKLATDFVTIPVLLNFNFTPGRENGFGLSLGMSAGYMYSSRQKLISSNYGKQKNHSSFNLEPWKLSYIAELNLGPVCLYGTYATKSMYKYGLNMTPYAVGIRLNSW